MGRSTCGHYPEHLSRAARALVPSVPDEVPQSGRKDALAHRHEGKDFSAVTAPGRAPKEERPATTTGGTEPADDQCPQWCRIRDEPGP